LNVASYSRQVPHQAAHRQTMSRTGEAGMGELSQSAFKRH